MKISLLLILILILSSCSSEQWYAMARHGECYDLSSFSKIDPIITGAQSPSEIGEKLKSAGIDFTLTKTKEIEGMYNLDVPSKNWRMIFVVKKYCQEFVERAVPNY